MSILPNQGTICSDLGRPFIEWLKDNELDTLSYAIFTRPKAPEEVLVFERYNSVSAFEAHRRSKVFRAMS